MSQELDKQISELWKSKWVDLNGLVICATTHFSTTESPNLRCDSISLLGQGSFNTVYRLAFGDGTEVAASISRYDESDFEPKAKHSEISTMKFVRESGLYPDIPVPKVFAWDLTFTNPACAPYVLMEVVPGVTAELAKGANKDMVAASWTRDFALVKSLAKLQASLFKPVPFDRLGSLVTDTDGKYILGPLMTTSQGTLGGPFESIQDLWRYHLEDDMMQTIKDWVNNETDNDARTYSGVEVYTPQTFVELSQLLSSLIPHFQPPKSCRSLVLYHPDIALRNVLFDEASLSSDSPKITGVIDWAGAQILPAMLTARYPGDLITDGVSPFTHSGNPKDPNGNVIEYWHSVPFDWTSTGEVSKWPQAFRDVNVLFDHAPLVHRNVRRYYLRAYFSACYAEQLYAQHGVADLACATMLKDAPYYLKFHEVIRGGRDNYLDHSIWIRETYWRLRMAGHGSKGLKELLVGPNLYREFVEPPVCDLGIFDTKTVPKEDHTK